MESTVKSTRFHRRRRICLERILHCSIMFRSRIAEYADIDTRRHMGFPPRKLCLRWKSFHPRRFHSEIFKYDPIKKYLSYYEFSEYGQVYYETVTNIIPVNDDDEWCWYHLEGSVTYGLFFSHRHIREYRRTKHELVTYFAGCPAFISEQVMAPADAQSPLPSCPCIACTGKTRRAETRVPRLCEMV